MPKMKKLIPVLGAAILFFSLLAVPALASGNVSTAIESTWKSAATQIKTVTNNVVFPAIDMILAILFFVKLATAWMDYRKHGQFEFAGPAIIFAGLLLALTAPLYLWSILGI